MIRLLSIDLLDRKIFGIRLRIIFPFLILALLVGGIFSPLFNINTIHGVPTARLFAQHFYFDTVAGLGGFWTAGFCTHWYHKIPLMIAIDLLSTLALVTLVG